MIGLNLFFILKNMFLKPKKRTENSKKDWLIEYKFLKLLKNFIILNSIYNFYNKFSFCLFFIFK